MITISRQRVSPNRRRVEQKATYGEELPRDVELVVADKVRVVTLKGVEDECPRDKPKGQCPCCAAIEEKGNTSCYQKTHSYASGILRSEKRRL